MSSERARLLLVSAVVVLVCQLIGAQSLTYSRGQNVSPAYEGWERNADGSFSFLFGYMNRNWEEEIDVPVGPDNDIEPGGPDQGQPTHYLPRRNRFMFKVRVPKDFGLKEMVWTLTTHGKTEKAYATLRTDYLLENVDLMSETGALGAGTSNPEVRADMPPVIRLEGETSRSVRVGQPLTLVAVVTDDGIPKPRFRGRTNEERAADQARARGDEARGRNPLMIPPRASRLEKSWACTCRGSSTAARARSQSIRLRSKSGRTLAPARIRRGRLSGLRHRCRLKENGSRRRCSPSRASTCSAPARTTGRSRPMMT